jgi:hypothetical protein
MTILDRVLTCGNTAAMNDKMPPNGTLSANSIKEEEAHA